MARKSEGPGDWLGSLLLLVEKRPLVIFRLEDVEWNAIEESRNGFASFTMARSRDSLAKIKAPTACLIFGGELFGDAIAAFALLSSKRTVTTLEASVRIDRAIRIKPSTEKDLIDLVTEKASATGLKKKLDKEDSVVTLSPKLSARIVEKLAAIDSNRAAMRAVIGRLELPRSYNNNDALQHDAIVSALKVFGIGPDGPASVVETAPDRETTLSRVNIREDAVIEHDARWIEGLKLTDSDVTGRAVFRNGLEHLEVITANKRPLEQVLGVDLIYLNTVMQNIVMVQYKMLDPEREEEGTDWIYRPDSQLKKELDRMKLFSRSRPARPLEYRINPQVFYFKFVRKDAALSKSTITIPIDHFEKLQKVPACIGPKGGFRISFDALNGRYLRQEAFIDLIRSGYIGAHADTTSDLTRLIEETLKDDRAVVAAVQSRIEPDFNQKG